MGCFSRILGLWFLFASTTCLITVIGNPSSTDVKVMLAMSGLGFLFGVALLLTKHEPSECEFCGSSLRETRYVWHVGGKRRTLCPRCNSTLEARMSQSAVADLGLAAPPHIYATPQDLPSPLGTSPTATHTRHTPRLGINAQVLVLAFLFMAVVIGGLAYVVKSGARVSPQTQHPPKDTK